MLAVDCMVAGTCSNFYLCLPANLGHVMNTKVFPIIVTYLLVKFQSYPNWIAQVIVKILEFQRGGS